MYDNGKWESETTPISTLNSNTDYIKNTIKNKRNLKRENETSISTIIEIFNRHNISLVN